MDSTEVQIAQKHAQKIPALTKKRSCFASDDVRLPPLSRSEVGCPLLVSLSLCLNLIPQSFVADTQGIHRTVGSIEEDRVEVEAVLLSDEAEALGAGGPSDPQLKGLSDLLLGQLTYLTTHNYLFPFRMVTLQAWGTNPHGGVGPRRAPEGLGLDGLALRLLDGLDQSDREGSVDRGLVALEDTLLEPLDQAVEQGGRVLVLVALGEPVEAEDLARLRLEGLRPSLGDVHLGEDSAQLGVALPVDLGLLLAGGSLADEGELGGVGVVRHV